MSFIYFRARNQWGPPDRKVDTRKYRAEPKSIFEYEPGKSSILEQERPVSAQKHVCHFYIRVSNSIPGGPCVCRFWLCPFNVSTEDTRGVPN